MSVSVLIICHHDIGRALVDAITTTLGGQLPLRLESFAISSDTDPDTVYPEINTVLANIDNGEGVLILTDLFGSTPCNIANRLQEQNKIKVVTGLNFPMLIRVMNYPNQNLDDLSETARKGGQEGIMICTKADSCGDKPDDQPQ